MSAFPFDAVIFDMDGVIVDTEYYYLGETAAFAKELGLNLTQEELNGQVGTSHQFFLRMLVDWFERAGKGHLTGEEALARWDEWAHKRPRDYQALINPGAVDTIRELPFAWRLPARLPWIASRKCSTHAGCRMPLSMW